MTKSLIFLFVMVIFAGSSQISLGYDCNDPERFVGTWEWERTVWADGYERYPTPGVWPTVQEVLDSDGNYWRYVDEISNSPARTYFLFGSANPEVCVLSFSENEFDPNSYALMVTGETGERTMMWQERTGLWTMYLNEREAIGNVAPINLGWDSIKAIYR